MKTAIVLFAHGSRDSLWRLPIEAVAAQLTARAPDVLTRCAYLELCAPSLAEAALELNQAGVQKLKIFPLFLGVGKHAREDLPELIQELRDTHPDIVVELLPTAGEFPSLISLLADIALIGQTTSETQ